MITYVLFLAGFVILTYGANFLVDGATSIAKRFNISDLLIGLTIVAFGTSMPEMIVSLLSSVQGSTELAIGNVLGSNIFNILLILGIAAIIYPVNVQTGIVKKEIPLSLFAAVLVYFFANDLIFSDAEISIISRNDGIILLAFFIIFIFYTIYTAKAEKVKGITEDTAIPKYGVFKSVLLITIGLTGLVVGGRWIVNGAVEIATLFELSESLIGLTIVAAGTSLPELATSTVAAFKRNSDIAIGNVVGSNIFNIFFILGTTATINDIPIGLTTNIDILVVIISTILLIAFVFTGNGRKISRFEGALLLSGYFIYTIYLIGRE
jgi:cation:H+ antiporter